jgi:transglutaminase-like putative cysteine protease
MRRLVFGPREGWLSLFLLMVVVLCPALSLASADWVDDLWIVPRLALAGLLLGFVLTKLPVRSFVAHWCAVEIGVLVVGSYFALQAPTEDWESRVVWLGGRVWAWLQVVFGGGMSNDSMLFALVMALTGWLLGYLAAWFAFKRHHVWLTLVACGGGLLVNLSYGAPDPWVYFGAFMLASLLLLIRITLYEKESDWLSADAMYGKSVPRVSFLGSSALSVGLLAFAWAIPIGTINGDVAESWYRVTGPWQGLQVEFDRLFASIGTSTPRGEGNRFGKALALKGAIELGPDLVMLVSSPIPEYWAAQSYDRYTGQGWMSSADQSTRLDSNDQRLVTTSVYKGRKDIEQRYKLMVGRMSSVFAANAAVKLSLPVYEDHFASLEEMSALRSTIPMRQGQQYAVISSVSVASEEQLRQAGTEYPEWTKRYLELPSPSPRRVVSMARRLARDSSDPYEAAVSIQQFLRRFRYEIKVATPPTDRDAVDWFLFTAKEGYCDYFASSMAVMARAVGIPSRVVAGYNTGTLNEQTGLYEVKQENAHSWPELFFPNYGWVRFEPTPSQPTPERPEIPAEETQAGTTDMGENSVEALGLDTSSRDGLLSDDQFDLESGALLADSNSSSDVVQTTIEWSRAAIPAGLVVLVLLLWWGWRRALARLSPSGRAYFQLCSVAALLGWRPRPSNTPAEYARVLEDASPAFGRELRTLVGCYVEETYGGRRPAGERVAESSWMRMRWRLSLQLLRAAAKRRLGRA